MHFSQKASTLKKTLQSTLRSERTLPFVSKCWSLKDSTLSLESEFSFLEALMRKAHAFLSKDKHFLQTLESIVRSVEHVALVSKCCRLTDNRFLSTCIWLLRSFHEECICVLSKGKDSLQTLQRSTFFTRLKALLDVKAVIHLFLNAVV